MKGFQLIYDEWCRRIAESRDLSDLIVHFREHVGNHYDRYNRGDEGSLDTWLVGAFNFMHILEKKFPHIRTCDLLFKLCTHYKDHKLGPDPPFDVDEFIKRYNGKIKKFHRRYGTK